MAPRPDHWPRVREVFEAALALPADARRAYIAKACDGDASLRQQVDLLLDSHERANSFLETPAAAASLGDTRITTHLEGRRIGPYLLGARIGAGGMGEVYKARDTRLDRTVAIKVLPAHVAQDPQTRERFEREARAVAALNHPHICTLHDVGHHDGIDYLVMEHLEGETLAARLSKGALPLADALRYAIEIASALDAAHRAGLVHRDLKPANVMLTKAGAKLLDFGLSKAFAPALAMGVTRATAAPDVTTPGTILGTVHYMAPEQVEGREADARSDIWALGVVIYEMTTGTHPFKGDSPASVIGAILRHDPPSMTSLQPMAPAALGRIVATCLAKDPDERWQSLADLKRELTWLQTRDVLDESVAMAQPRSRARWILPSTALASAAAAVALTLLAVSSGSRTVAPSTHRVTRLEINFPGGVEVGSTNTPNLAISPDGTRLAFIGALGGLRKIFIRRFDEFETVSLRTGTDTANICVFSPDGAALAFITSDRTLKKVSFADGLVTTIAADADFTAAGVTWGTDGEITFGRAGALWQVSATGGPERRLTTLDGSKDERMHGWPTALPGGKVILFTTVTGGDRVALHIDAFSVASGQRRRVIDDGSNPLYTASGHLVFFRDGSLLAAPFKPDTLEVTGAPVAVLDNISLDQLGNPMITISSAGQLAYVPNGNATRRLVWVSRQGVEQPITDTSRPYQNPRLGPDGHRIVVEVAGGDLWIQDTARGTFTRLTSKDTAGNTFAVWTPDARRIVFRTLTGLRWIEPDGGAGSHAIAGSTSVSDIPTSVSPDGQTLLFVRQSSTTSGDLYALTLSGEPKPRPAVQTSGYDGGGQFSPDGHWMAYVSNESGQFEVYVRPYPGPDRKLLVSTHGGTHPKWNSNGRELLYRNGNKMMAVDVSTSRRVQS